VPLRLTVVCVLLCLATAAPASADPLATTVVSGSVPGPASTFTEVTATADCAGQLVSGGGTRLAQSTDTVLHNGIHIEGSFPSPDGRAQSADGDAGPTRWVAAGGSGGGVPDDAQTLAYAICIGAGGPTMTRVIASSARGPSATFQMVRTTATCAGGTRLVGGGSRTTPGTVGSLKPNGSFPSDATGNPLTTGTNPASWTVTGLNGGGGDAGNTTFAFALCASAGSLPTVTVVHGEAPGPALATTPLQTTASCPAQTALLGGGAFISDAFGLPGSQGDHLTGSYPSDATGTPVGGGPASAWTAASHTGGVDSGSLTQTDVWALCASPADQPPPTTGPSPPVSGGAPKVAGKTIVGSVLTESHAAWTNRPTAYSYRWLRCASATCTTIVGARGHAYRLTQADIAARIRVQETAANGAGRSPPAVSAATASVQPRHPVATSRILALLAWQIVPVTRLAGVLRQGAGSLEFTALGAGRLTVSWYLADTLVARGSQSFAGARATTITVRLTAAGRRVLPATTSVRLTAKGSFTPRGKAPITASRSFVLGP
jgi:hypothetical protein